MGNHVNEPVTLENAVPVDISHYNVELSQKENECEQLQKTNLGNKSNSYPKISPSRKVQNINIVLDPPSNSEAFMKNSRNIDINSNMDTEINRMTEHFENSFAFNDSENDKCISSIADNTNQSSYFNNSLVNAISPKPYSKKVGTPFMTPASEFKVNFQFLFLKILFLYA